MYWFIIIPGHLQNMKEFTRLRKSRKARKGLLKVEQQGCPWQCLEEMAAPMRSAGVSFWGGGGDIGELCFSRTH